VSYKKPISESIRCTAEFDLLDVFVAPISRLDKSRS
jgi:hypothetical protein